MRIKELRISQGLTQQEVANRLNIERTSYARYESGSREPDVATLIAMADLFQVSLDYLCGRTDTPYYVQSVQGGAVLTTQKEPPARRDERPPVAAQFEVNTNDLPKDRKELEQFVLELLRKNR